MGDADLDFSIFSEPHEDNSKELNHLKLNDTKNCFDWMFNALGLTAHMRCSSSSTCLRCSPSPGWHLSLRRWAGEVATPLTWSATM